MGVVYRATHLLLERTVALKLIAPGLARNPAFRSRFEREWRLLAALEHPNVIPIYEAGEGEGRRYLPRRAGWGGGGPSGCVGCRGVTWRPACAARPASRRAWRWACCRRWGRRWTRRTR